MFGLPYRQITIRTHLDRQKIIENLRGVVGPGKDFKGKLGDRQFRIRRSSYSWGRDPYRPVIRGMIVSVPTGTVLKLTFYPRFIEVVQIMAIFGFAEYLAVSKDISMWWWPIAALTFVHIGLCTFSLIPGQRWAEGRLRNALTS